MPLTDLTPEQFAKLDEAAKPLWDALGELGWVDAHGGMEYERVFPEALKTIYHQANVMPFMTPCEQCGTDMNPAEAMLGATCGKCCKKNHKEVCG